MIDISVIFWLIGGIAEGNSLNGVALILAGILSLLGGFVLLDFTWWNVSFNFTSDKYATRYISLIFVSALLIWLGMWLVAAGFGVFGHDALAIFLRSGSLHSANTSPTTPTNTSASPTYSMHSHRSMRLSAKIQIFGWLIIAAVALVRLIVLLIRW